MWKIDLSKVYFLDYLLVFTCTDKLRETTEEVIEELSKAIFSVSEPRWITQEDAKQIKSLKRRVKDLYAKY